MTFLTKPLIALKTMLSRSQTFQTLVAVADEAAALAFIEIETMPADVYTARALVGWQPNTTHSRESLNTGRPWLTTGQIAFFIQAPIADESVGATAASALIFFDTLANIITDVSKECGKQDTINISEMSIPGINRSEPEKRTNTDIYEGWVVCSFRQPK